MHGFCSSKPDWRRRSLAVPPSEPPESLAHAHQLAVECQITAIELAHQMMDRADEPSDRAMAQHSLQTARRTYELIVRRLTHLHPTATQARQIDQRLTSLKARLEAAQA